MHEVLFFRHDPGGFSWKECFHGNSGETLAFSQLERKNQGQTQNAFR